MQNIPQITYNYLYWTFGDEINFHLFLSRQQKLGPIFYQEPPPTFYFSNDTGKLSGIFIMVSTNQSYILQK